MSAIKTKLWQMVGRGTRLCPDLLHRTRTRIFYIFDLCQNLKSSARIPKRRMEHWDVAGEKCSITRLEFIAELDKKRYQ